MAEKITEKGYTIRCSGHKYITLEYDGKFIVCLDNDFIRAEEMIFLIEKRTGMNFNDIPIKGQKDDFNGLSFFNGGWKRNFWNEFPSKKEVDGYIKMKNGIIVKNERKITRKGKSYARC